MNLYPHLSCCDSRHRLEQDVVRLVRAGRQVLSEMDGVIDATEEDGFAELRRAVDAAPERTREPESTREKRCGCGIVWGGLTEPFTCYDCGQVVGGAS